MRPRLTLRIPPKTAHQLAHLVATTGNPPAEIARKALAMAIERQAKSVGVKDDWSEVEPKAIELMPKYMSKEACLRYLKRLYGRER